MPKQRFVLAICAAASLVFDKPVDEAKFLNAPVVLDQVFAELETLVLAKFTANPTEFVVLLVRVLHPVGNPVDNELKS